MCSRAAARALATWCVSTTWWTASQPAAAAALRAPALVAHLWGRSLAETCQAALELKVGVVALRRERCACRTGVVCGTVCR